MRLAVLLLTLHREAEVLWRAAWRGESRGGLKRCWCRCAGPGLRSWESARSRLAAAEVDELLRWAERVLSARTLKEVFAD